MLPLDYTKEKGNTMLEKKVIDLLAGDPIKFGELEFSQSLFALPEKWYADFTKAQLRNKFVEKDGKQVRTDVVEKIIVPAYDADVVEALAKVGQGHEQLKSLDVVITGDIDRVCTLVENEHVGPIRLLGIKIKPKWVSRIDNDGNRTGSWNDIQVVADKVEIVTENKGNDNSGKPSMPKI